MPRAPLITNIVSINIFNLLRFFDLGFTTIGSITKGGGNEGRGGNGGSSGSGSSISGYNASKSESPGASGISELISSHFLSRLSNVIGVTSVATAPEEYGESDGDI